MRRYEIIVPELGTDRPISLGLWLLERGAAVVAGEPVVELLAGEVVVDLSAAADGVLAEKFVGEDKPVEPGRCLGIIEARE